MLNHNNFNAFNDRIAFFMQQMAFFTSTKCLYHEGQFNVWLATELKLYVLYENNIDIVFFLLVVLSLFFISSAVDYWKDSFSK